MMNLQQASISGLYASRRQLIHEEPANHNPLECGNPATCPKCIQWREWAKQLVQINREIAERESK
jgi:hypothetical protein